MSYVKTDEAGTIRYYLDEAMTIRHRHDGPAVVCPNGVKVWYQYGELHRVDGPAIEHADGSKSWYLRGVRHPDQAEVSDAVNHPRHYTQHPSGVECIEITEGMNFCLGNAMKYIWRADAKNNDIEDLEKARWYLTREIARRAKIKS